MTKIIKLKLVNLTYGGNSIGDDIRIEIEALNIFLGLNKRIKRGSAVEINKDIGQFFADGTSFAIPVNIKIIERDLIFNDVGSRQEKMKIDLNNHSLQPQTYTLEIQESRNFLSKKKATFKVTLGAVVSEAALYVADEGGDGWVVAVSEHSAKKISLPYHLKVALEKQDDKRQYFNIREGIVQDTKASVKIESNGASHLSAEHPHTDPVLLTYSLSRNTLMLNRKTYKVLPFPDDPEPWKKGVYDLEIPDAPHLGGGSYLERAKLAKVWFRIGHSGERYLHTGRVTLGCVTMTEIEHWDDLCNVLMKARKGDGKSVGTLEVIN